MLLRESSEKIGAEVDLAATVKEGESGGIAHGAELVRFGEAVTRGSEDIEPSREALRAAIGEEAFLEAAAIVGIFNGLVRNADFSGIPLDDPTLHTSKDFRAELGIDHFSGASNSDLERADPSLAPERGFAPPPGSES